MRFKDKVTAVTGGASGLGEEIAQEFAREGSTVVILDILEEKAVNTAKKIEAQGGKALAIKVDVTSRPEIELAIERVVGGLGRIDILVNNVGLSESIPFLEADEALWRKVLDVNLMSTLLCCHAVLPHMVREKYGKIINVASIAGRLPRPMAVAYGAAKAGIISVTKSLAVAMAPYNIRVNCVAPGSMDTELTRRLKPEHVESIVSQAALKRLGLTKEVAAAVLFLASDEALFIVGQTLAVDGGNNML